jgi:diguanylate cyclase (GGDEF)-like protein
VGLRQRFLLVVVGVCGVAIVLTLLAFGGLVGSVAGGLGSAYARQYALANRSLLEEPLEREVALARQLADSPVIRSWARDDISPEARRRAFAELESYRTRFAGRSWFYVVESSLRYYYDDESHPYGETRLAYTLDRGAAKDAWYFATLAQVADYAVNVNYDVVLDAYKVWINVVVRETNGGPLGIAGSGIDLSVFLRNFIDAADPGVENLVLDRNLAIQAYRDRSLIDFQSLAKEPSQRSTAGRIFRGRGDMARLAAAAARLRAGSATEVLSVATDGGRRLLGVTYLASLDWYVVSAVDLDRLIGSRLYWPVSILGIVAMALLACAVALAVDRMVLRPVSGVTAAARRMAAGRYDPAPVSRRTDEIGTLSRTFAELAERVRTNTDELEARVRARTAELDAANARLAASVRALEEAATTDPLTGLLNRRGLLASIQPDLDRVARGNSSLALFLTDLDNFKLTNDAHGHEAGDAVLSAAAAAVRRSVRSYDRCARWGGEEFLVAAPAIDLEAAERLAEKIREVIGALEVGSRAGVLRVTASVGGAVVAAGETLDAALARADGALYRAKAEGRNRAVVDHGGGKH